MLIMSLGLDKRMRNGDVEGVKMLVSLYMIGGDEIVEGVLVKKVSHNSYELSRLAFHKMCSWLNGSVQAYITFPIPHISAGRRKKGLKRVFKGVKDDVCLARRRVFDTTVSTNQTQHVCSFPSIYTYLLLTKLKWKAFFG
jgi:hypothetical protein